MGTINICTKDAKTGATKQFHLGAPERSISHDGTIEVKIGGRWRAIDPIRRAAEVSARQFRQFERDDRVLRFHVMDVEVVPGGNWNGPGDWFPRITVDQQTRTVMVRRCETFGHQRRASVDTLECTVDIAADGQAAYVRGRVRVRNWSNYQCSGEQGFVFAVFVGDSGHVYIHRATATNGWLTAAPDGILERLRKLGIGRPTPEGTVQQGDYLLVPVHARNAYLAGAFQHETMGSGHHRFAAPVLFADGQFGRQILVTEPLDLRHEATDGIQHPTVTVPPGQYAVATTATSLAHRNRRD